MASEDQSEEEAISYHNVDHVTTERQLPGSTVYRDAISGSCCLHYDTKHTMFIRLYISMYSLSHQHVFIHCGRIAHYHVK